MLDFAFDPVAYFSKTRPDKVACRDLDVGRSLTYAQLDARASQFAAALRRMLPNVKGARVASLARNSSDLLCLYLACLRTGAIYAPLNWRLTAAELATIASGVGPSLLVYDAEFEDAASGVSAAAFDALFIRTGAALEAEIAAAPTQIGADRIARGDDVTVLLSTSGTTGRPKAVMVTERNAQATALNYSTSAEVGPHSVLLCNMPLFHVVGLLAVARTTLQMGATLLVAARFDAAETVAHITNPGLGVTHYFCAPQMAQMMRRAANFDPAPFRRLTALQTGGAPHAAIVVREWIDDGVRMVDGFGMSEAGTVLGMPPGNLDLLRRKAGSAGLPAITVELRLVARDGGEAADGETGEVWLRGPSVTPGYWSDEAATRAAFEDGWFKSGDAARRDEDGFYTIVDRWKDMYVSGGENVYPAEVEAALAACAGVHEMAIVGVPDSRWGETGVAFIVPAAGANVSADEIIRHCRAHLAAYKAPRHVVFVEALPRTASGKLQKGALREQWAKVGEPNA